MVLKIARRSWRLCCNLSGDDERNRAFTMRRASELQRAGGVRIGCSVVQVQPAECVASKRGRYSVDGIKCALPCRDGLNSRNLAPVNFPQIRLVSFVNGRCRVHHKSYHAYFFLSVTPLSRCLPTELCHPQTDTV